MCKECYVKKYDRGCEDKCYCSNCQRDTYRTCTNWCYEPPVVPASNPQQVEQFCNYFAQANLKS